MTRELCLALRLDDVGAASKAHEVYSKLPSRLGRAGTWGNWLFLKYLPGLKAWGPYKELSARDWYAILEVLERRGAVLTVAITAAWVERDGSLVPFPEKFPAAAAAIRAGIQKGLLEVANHGLSHCVLNGGAYLPRAFSSNRRFHREFWDWVPVEEQERHIAEAQKILIDYFGQSIVTFVPPGNVFSCTTLEIAYHYGLRVLSCQGSGNTQGPLQVVNNREVIGFHDRDIVLHGVVWLERKIEKLSPARFVHVRDLVRGGPLSEVG